MAKVKYEFLQKYYQTVKRHPLRDYLFAYIDRFGKLGSTAAPLVNFLLDLVQSSRAGARLFRITPNRQLPRLARHSLRWFMRGNQMDGIFEADNRPVFLLSDAFSAYFEPGVSLSAMRVLTLAGCQVILLPVIGAGRTLISKGFLKEARQHALRVVKTIKELDPEGLIPVVGTEPSEIYTLRDEFVDLFPSDPFVQGLAKRAWMIDEFLVRGSQGELPLLLRIANNKTQLYDLQPIKLHGHCYQKAQPPSADGLPVGAEATKLLLFSVGYKVEMIGSGCCGMAGAFGYESENYDLSMKIGELALFPAVRQASNDFVIAAAGVSCRAQIKDGTGCLVVHPIELVEKACCD